MFEKRRKINNCVVLVLAPKILLLPRNLSSWGLEQLRQQAPRCSGSTGLHAMRPHPLPSLLGAEQGGGAHISQEARPGPSGAEPGLIGWTCLGRAELAQVGEQLRWSVSHATGRAACPRSIAARRRCPTKTKARPALEPSRRERGKTSDGEEGKAGSDTELARGREGLWCRGRADIVRVSSTGCGRRVGCVC